jgi:integrase
VAHIAKRGAKWRARYPHPTIRNKQIEKRFNTKREAENWLATQRHAVLNGSHIDPATQRTTHAELAQIWTTTWRSLEPKTVAGYTSILKTHLLPEFGSTQLGNLSPQRIEAFLGQLTRTTSPGTARNVFAALRTSFNTAVRLRLIASNPTQYIRPPRPTHRQMLFLTSNEVHQLADAIPFYYKTLIYTAAYTGLRAGELLALQVHDFNPFTRTLHVHRALKEVNGQLSFGPTKNHKSRTVSLPTFLAKMLAAHLDAKSKPPSSASGDSSSLVFSTPTGSPLRHGNFYRYAFRPAVQRALPHKPDLRFHDLRHTAASLAIAAGAHPKLIQARLGHASITTTLDRYGHLFPSVEEALADALDAAFNETPPNVIELRAAGERER